MYTRQPQHGYQSNGYASTGPTSAGGGYATSSLGHHNANFYSTDQPTFDRRNQPKLDLIQQELADTRKVVKELKEHARVQRVPISKVSSELIQFVISQQASDCLVVGFGGNDNPFLKKKDCCAIM